jgi:DNA-directed RNA polymerase delta subunit
MIYSIHIKTVKVKIWFKGIGKAQDLQLTDSTQAIILRNNSTITFSSLAKEITEFLQVDQSTIEGSSSQADVNYLYSCLVK